MITLLPWPLPLVNFSLTLSSSRLRARFAAAWPILIGAKTIGKLGTANVNQLQQRVKVSRSEVRGIIAFSVLACPFPFLWRQLFSPTVKAVAPNGNLA